MGASSGIGYEVARCFIILGWKVGVAARRTEPLTSLRLMAEDRVFMAEIDVNAIDVADHLHSLIDEMNGVEVYFHSSGIGMQNPNLDVAKETATVTTNGLGFVRVIDTMYNYFRAQGKGHIAVISSIAGTRGLGVAPAYSATKRMQNCYIQALAQLSHMQKANITFTDIRPGFVKTDLLSDGQFYPMLLDKKYAADKIVKAVLSRKRIAIIDWRYAILVALWQLIPNRILERLTIRTSS